MPDIIQPIKSDPIAMPAKKPEGKPNLIGMNRAQMSEALEAILPDAKARKMRVSQLWQWIYAKGVSDFSLMSNLSKDFREVLVESFVIERPEIALKQLSNDGTRKYLLRVAGGHEVEMVYIPGADRGTLCISSQIGCTLTCSFCHTGTQKLVRNLSVAEIVGQVMLARDDLEDWPTSAGDQNRQRKITNIVLMGMGEPLYNFDHVRDAMLITMDDAGISMSRRKITLSTSGVVPAIAKVGLEIGCLLAISFHATTDDVRDMLVPINKKWNIEALLQACRDYPTLSNSERITFEYVMIQDVNDSDDDARRLVKLISGIPAKINLIPFNSWPGSNYLRSTPEQIERFASIVMRAGYASPVRTPRGEDILAACGQLKSASERGKKSKAELEAEL